MSLRSALTVAPGALSALLVGVVLIVGFGALTRGEGWRRTREATVAVAVGAGLLGVAVGVRVPPSSAGITVAGPLELLLLRWLLLLSAFGAVGGAVLIVIGVWSARR